MQDFEDHVALKPFREVCTIKSPSGRLWRANRVRLKTFRSKSTGSG